MAVAGEHGEQDEAGMTDYPMRDASDTSPTPAFEELEATMPRMPRAVATEEAPSVATRRGTSQALMFIATSFGRLGLRRSPTRRKIQSPR